MKEKKEIEITGQECPQWIIDICLNCPFEAPVCGRDGCEYFAKCIKKHKKGQKKK